MALPDEKVIAPRERLFSLVLERAAHHKHAGRTNKGRPQRADSHIEILHEDTEVPVGSKVSFRLTGETVVIEILSADSVCIFNRIVNSGRSVRKLFSHGYDAEFSGEIPMKYLDANVFIYAALIVDQLCDRNRRCFRIFWKAKMNVVEKLLEPRIRFTSFLIISMPSALKAGYRAMCAVNAGQFATVLRRQHCVRRHLCCLSYIIA